MTYKILCPANLRVGFSLTFSHCQPLPYPSPYLSVIHMMKTWGDAIYIRRVGAKPSVMSDPVRLLWSVAFARLLCSWDS